MEKQELEKKIEELEKKLEAKKTSANKIPWVSLIGWIILISILIIVWLNIKPLLNKTNNLLDLSTNTVKKIDSGATTSNKILNKVSHPIDSISEGIGF